MADILTPALGESVTEATIARWTKKPGDPVKKDEVLVELDTDKVSLEVSAPEDGVLSAIDAPEGATVTPGQRLGAVNGAGAGKSAAPTPAPASAAPAPAPAAPDAARGSAPAASAEVAPQQGYGSAGGLEVTVPAMGESVTEGTVGQWTKKPGDRVAKDEVLVEIETDKVAVEIASPADGVLTEVVANPGDTVTPNQVIARVSASGAPASQAVPAATQAAQPAGGPDGSSASGAQPNAALPLSPSVQRIVAENGLDPSRIPASGKDGRITKGDALAALQGRAAPQPAAPTPPAPDYPAFAAPAPPRRRRPPHPARSPSARSVCA